ncbi:Nascent polypeptide-associated complex subunit beta [Dissophora globulifera]|uniref:Nascent polypeptide-associated complex subunit beta n=1 Tax=Dissophora globulifera TaxID=979702 RepID=A0A9P6RHP5_9FUNG|nr:Nascent polypeptide-associated complex subunit beta [Dissophora globulifera]
MNPEKLAKLQANQNRSKGAPRRVIKKVHRAVAQDDRKLQGALEKLALVPQAYVEEVNMFLEEGTVLHFRQPKVHVSAASNTYAIYGRGEEKELTELLPGILNQLGPDSLASLRRIAETYQQSAAGQAALAAAGTQGDDDDEVPDLVESFEDATIEETKEEASA